MLLLTWRHNRVPRAQQTPPNLCGRSYRYPDESTLKVAPGVLENLPSKVPKFEEYARPVHHTVTPLMYKQNRFPNTVQMLPEMQIAAKSRVYKEYRMSLSRREGRGVGWPKPRRVARKGEMLPFNADRIAPPRQKRPNKCSSIHPCV